MNKLILVDGNNLYAIAYYSLKGNTSQLIDTFIGMLRSICEREQDATHMFIAWDSRESRKKKEDEAYKAGRQPKPPNYYNVWQPLQDRLTQEKVQQYQVSGIEADDIIAKIIKAAKKKQCRCVIVSRDKDMYPLLEEDDTVYVYNPVDQDWFDYKKFVNKYGIKPNQYNYVVALMGKASNNTQGVKGIGERTAFKAIQTYGSLDGLYASDMEEVAKRFRKMLKEGKEDAYKTLKQIAFLEDFQLPKSTYAQMPEIFRF